MRIVRAGEMPSAAAAACSEVVANGVGGCCLRERWRLHAAGGAHVTKAAKLGERQVTREHRAPNEVDVLATLAGVGQVVVERDEMIEGLRDLGLGKRRVLGAGDRQVGRHLAHLVESVRANQLALAVEVRGNNDAVGLFSEVLERTNELLLGR